MTDNQIREHIKSGWPFFGVTSRVEVLARYISAVPMLSTSTGAIGLPA
ncbi:MAG: hypothetical protein ACOYB3_16045 [Azonexus sp.]|jgi:hypothetical protein